MRASDSEEQAQGTPANPVTVALVAGVRNVDHLRPGYQGGRTTWTFRSFKERRGADLESWVALFESISKHGIRDPLIVYKDRVLWGMRRLEIAGLLGITTVRVLEIADDPGHWSLEDVRAFRRRMNL